MGGIKVILGVKTMAPGQTVTAVQRTFRESLLSIAGCSVERQNYAQMLTG